MATAVGGAVPTIGLPSGPAVPVLGQGTWRLGEGRRPRADEVAALQLGLDLGMTLIDTAEMYGDGATEELVGAAIAGRRDGVFLVSKVLPGNATRQGTIAACERSLRRLGTDRLDLYLLHWRGGTPLQETLAGFEALVEAGKIRHWGVSNLDTAELEEILRLPGGGAVQTNQVLYNLTRRRIESDLLRWCRAHDLPVMAYSPIEQGRLLGRRELRAVAAQHGATPAQVAPHGCSGNRGSSSSAARARWHTSGRTARRLIFASVPTISRHSSARSRRRPGNGRSRCSDQSRKGKAARMSKRSSAKERKATSVVTPGAALGLSGEVPPVEPAPDEVELDSRDSFPASDPPSWTPVIGTGTPRTR